MGDIDVCGAVAVRVGLDRSVLRVIFAIGRPPIAKAASDHVDGFPRVAIA